jgi:ABC-type phosphate transport system substrate-binding protein
MVVTWLAWPEGKDVRRNFAEGGLRKWVSEKWVDIGAPKKDGKYQPCGRSKGSKRKYPKCVPLAKATQMTKSQKASAVKRKRAAGNPGGKPTNVATFTKRTKKAMGGYTGPAINSNYGGVTLNNPSYGKYYKGMI